MKRGYKIALTALVLVFAFSCLFFSCNGKKGDEKVLYSAVISKIKGFDPAMMSDLYTSTVAGNIMEGLYQYKYLADNYELEPCVAESMPTVSQDGLTYTIKIKKDAYFYDPEKQAFTNGKGRPVTAKDFVYSIKRLADPIVQANGWWLFDGFIVGLNEWRDAAEKASKDNPNFKPDYSTEIEGVKAIDDYTLQIKLTKVYPQILYTFAMPYTYPVAAEAMAKFGEDWTNHPIGTGPYYLDPKATIADNQYVLVKNPAWRKVLYPSEGGTKAKEKGLLADAGKRLPFVDKVIYYVIEESNPMWLKLMNGDLDSAGIPKDNFKSTVTPSGSLTPEMETKGLILDVNPGLDVTYDFFNMEDPILGKNVKLRQAISMAIDRDKILEIFYNGRAIKAQSVIPPGLGGYDPKYSNPNGVFDIEKAKALMAEAGYPNGKGLPVISYFTLSDTTSRQWAELYKENLSKIGINLKIDTGDWPTFLGLVDQHKVQFSGMGWGADYPDAQNFLQLLYGPNKAPGPNASNYDNAEFNKIYEKAIAMQDTPERSKLYAQLAQMANADCPWINGYHRLSYTLFYKWVKNYFYRDIGAGFAKYKDIDLALKAKLKNPTK